MKIPQEQHETLVTVYEHFLGNTKEYIQLAKSTSPYVGDYNGEPLPNAINPVEPYSISRIFMNVLGGIFMEKGGHLHFYKKL